MCVIRSLGNSAKANTLWLRNIKLEKYESVWTVLTLIFLNHRRSDIIFVVAVIKVI